MLRPIAIVLAFALAGCEASTAQSAVLLLDARTPEPPENLSDWDAMPAVVQARADAQRYWQTLHPDASWHPSLDAATRGAFSEAGATEWAVAYTLGSSGRCCPHGGLAIVRDGDLVRNFATGYGAHGLLTVPDADRDGRDEIAFVSGHTGMGYHSGSVMIGEVAGSGVETWGSAGTYEDDCGSEQTGATASRVLVVPGPAPAFYRETFRQDGCSDWNTGARPSAWSRVGARVPMPLEALDTDEGSLFVPLPLR